LLGLSDREFKIIRNLIIVTTGIFFFMLSYCFFRAKIFQLERVVSRELEIKDTTVHFLNTGNSDCILVKGEKTILIDGADNNDENMIVAYLKKEGIKQIDYMIATHNHKDHIGSLDRVIKEFEVKNILVSNGKLDTKAYYEFIDAMDFKSIIPKIPSEGELIVLGEDSYIKIYNTKGGTYTNDESLITLYCNGTDKFLFAGDAEKTTEERVLEKMEKVDVLKIGHHGSASSTTEIFLDKLKPQYAVITNSESNVYANPAKEVMKRLKERNIEVHRTDECGHVVFLSTGNGIFTECGIGSYGYRTVKEVKGVAKNVATSFLLNNNSCNRASIFNIIC
jgi:beta-lactamase superfamily II metal-dependent hydrolase